MHTFFIVFCFATLIATASAVQCDSDVNPISIYKSISEACSPLSAVTPSQNDCTACANAIADARAAAACFSLSSSSSDEVLSLLSDLAIQACGGDVATKSLIDSDIFGNTSRTAATACQTGICDSECESALNSLVGAVKDAYNPLDPPNLSLIHI